MTFAGGSMTVVPRQSPLVPLARIAVLVALGDLLTKQAALLWIGAFEPRAASVLHFGVVHNDRGAFGLSAGAYTFEISLALTLATIVLIVPVARDLARVDANAPAALGLIAGGAAGNLVSLLISPRGVVDFIALQRADGSGIVLNVADVAAYAGIAILMRTAALVVLEMRRPAVAAPRPADAVRAALLARLTDVEVARAIHRDVGAPSDAPLGERRNTESPGAPADRPVHLRVVHADGHAPRRGQGLTARLRAKPDAPRGGHSSYLRPMSHTQEEQKRR